MIPIPQDSAVGAEQGEAPDDDNDFVAAARVSVLATCQCAPSPSSELAPLFSMLLAETPGGV